MWHFTWTKLISLYLRMLSSLLYVLTTPKRMLCDKFCWYWHTGSGEETTICYFTSTTLWFSFLRLANIERILLGRHQNVEIIPDRQSDRRTYWIRTTGDQNSSFRLSVQKRIKVYMKDAWHDIKITDILQNFMLIKTRFGVGTPSGKCFGLLFIGQILLLQLFGLSFSSGYKG